MSQEMRSSGAVIYRIRVRGRLDADWADWFAGFSVAPLGTNGTVLIGPVVDQGALLGLLARLANLRLELQSVERIGFLDPPTEEDSNDDNLQRE